MVTFLVNVPMNEELARVGEVGRAPRADQGILRRPVELLNGCALSFVAGAPRSNRCLSPRPDSGSR